MLRHPNQMRRMYRIPRFLPYIRYPLAVVWTFLWPPYLAFDHLRRRYRRLRDQEQRDQEQRDREQRVLMLLWDHANNVNNFGDIGMRGYAAAAA
jgi:hypothetical protein